MNFILIVVLILASFIEAGAQQYYPIFTQNYSNPYSINPSFLTMGRRPEINATYRQQWVGITDGPQTMQFDIQYPFSPRISVGVNLYNDKTILLSSSGALATFGYRVSIATNHVLGFGLSGGFVSNQIDLEGIPDLDLIDPVLLNSSNNFDFDGQFGMHYQTGNFILGLSLLKLIDNRPFSDGSVEREKFDPFKDRAGMLGYRLGLSDEIFLQPTLFYRSTYSGYEYFEGSLLINYKNTVILGAGYRKDFGPHAMIRIRLSGLQVGYSYDFPSTQYGGSTGGTHEVQLKFQFGNTFEPRGIVAKNDSIAPVQETPLAENIREPTVLNEAPEKAVVKERILEQPAAVTIQDNKVDEGKTEVSEVKFSDLPDNNKPFDISETDLTGNATYQLVVGAYARRAYADRFARQLLRQGIVTKVVTGDTHLYYVIIPSYASKTISRDRVLEIRSNTQFQDAWFKSFD